MTPIQIINNFWVLIFHKEKQKQKEKEKEKEKEKS
jgi:hypothetical protein